MKKFLIIILCLCMSLSFVACGVAKAETDDEIPRAENRGERFVVVDYDQSGDYRIYVDKKTKVMYLFVKDGYGGGLTVMVTRSGDPLLWDREVVE